jgi:hypothetical protein
MSLHVVDQPPQAVGGHDDVRIDEPEQIRFRDRSSGIPRKGGAPRLSRIFENLGS